MSSPVPSYSYGRRVSARLRQKIWNGQGLTVESRQ